MIRQMQSNCHLKGLIIKIKTLYLVFPLFNRIVTSRRRMISTHISTPGTPGNVTLLSSLHMALFNFQLPREWTLRDDYGQDPLPPRRRLGHPILNRLCELAAKVVKPKETGVAINQISIIQLKNTSTSTRSWQVKRQQVYVSCTILVDKASPCLL